MIKILTLYKELGPRLNIIFDVQTQCGDNKIFSIEFHNLVIFYFMFITGF
jgi:hypothetical protein